MHVKCIYIRNRNNTLLTPTSDSGDIIMHHALTQLKLVLACIHYSQGADTTFSERLFQLQIMTIDLPSNLSLADLSLKMPSKEFARLPSLSCDEDRKHKFSTFKLHKTSKSNIWWFSFTFQVKIVKTRSFHFQLNCNESTAVDIVSAKLHSGRSVCLHCS